MENARYHLVFEGFKPDANKTAVSFSLKDQLSLKDSQINDMMAGRRTVLKENLNKESAQKLGRELTQAGLIIKAKALAVNQKNSPEEVRKHLLNGGIEQYFASKYRHASDEMETQFSLIILAAMAVGTYFILPLIGLAILSPLLNVSIWGSQFVAAFIQLLIASLFFIPAVVLRPRPAQVDGIAVDKDTEELLWRLTDSLADYLSAPKVADIVLVNDPVLNVHQSPKQWLKNSCTLEIGLPVMESLTLQQFVGLLAMRMTPRASRFYALTWGLFIQWYRALRNLHKKTALLLNNWVLPMYEHQNQRAQNIAKDLVGLGECRRLQKIEKRFTELERDWPEFTEYCHRLRLRGTQWQSLVVRDSQADKENDEIHALFRIESPALWALSTTDGYQKAISRQQGQAVFTMPGQHLWQTFQKYIPLADRFTDQLIRPEALIPPTDASPRKKRPNTLLLNRQAQDVLHTQQLLIEQSLELHAKPKKIKDVNVQISKWRATANALWPDDALQHKLMGIGKGAFSALQTLQQIQLWRVNDQTLPQDKQRRRDQQILKQHQKWVGQIQRLPALPLLPSGSGKLSDQIQTALGETPLTEMSVQDILQHQAYFLDLTRTYWVFIAGQILKPKTFADEMEQQA